MNIISNSSSIPQYLQIQEKIKQFIQVGRIRPGEKLPSENTLASQFGVSRMTVRHALEKLAQENIIEKRHGLGNLVTNNSDVISAELTFPPSLTKQLNDAGYPSSSKILSWHLTRNLPTRCKELLKIKPNEQVVFLERLRFGADIPLAINRSWVPNKLVRGITKKDLIEGSLIKTLIENYQILPTNGIEWVEPTVASIKEAELLKVMPGAPLLLMTMISFMEDGTPVEFSKTLWRGDKLRLQINSRNFEIALN